MWAANTLTLYYAVSTYMVAWEHQGVCVDAHAAISRTLSLSWLFKLLDHPEVFPDLLLLDSAASALIHSYCPYVASDR